MLGPPLDRFPSRVFGSSTDSWSRAFLQPDLLPARFSKYLLLGNAELATRVPMLKRLGVTAILDVSGSERDEELLQVYAQAGIKHKAVAAEDNPRYNIIDKHLKEATAFLEPFVARDGVVLVHCHQGINRSAALSIAFLMLHEHWPLPELLRHAFAQRPRLLTNLGFRKQLVKLAIEHNLLAVPIEHAPTPSNAARWSELGGQGALGVG